MNSRTLLYMAHLFVCLMPTVCFAQPAFTRIDSIRVFQWLDKAEEFFVESKYDSALHYCNKAEQYSKNKNFKKGLAWAFIKRTDILIDNDELNEADRYPPQTNGIGLLLKDSLIAAISWMQMAQVKMYQNKYDAAVPLFEKATRFYFEKHPSTHAALAYNDFGYTWGRKGELQNQAIALLKSISIYELLGPGNDAERGIAYNNLSTVYAELKDLDKAIEYGKTSLIYREKAGDIAKLALGCCNISQLYRSKKNTAEAWRYQQLCEKYALQSGNEARITHAYITAAVILSDQNDLKGSMEYERKGIALLEKTGKDKAQLANRYLSLGISSNRLNEDSITTFTYYQKGMDLAASVDHKFALREGHFHLYDFFKKHNDFRKAIGHYEKYVLYKDSIVKGNTAASIAELEKKYETAKKDNEIAQLVTERRIKALLIEKQNALLAGNELEAQKKQNEIALLSQAKELQTLEFKRQGEELSRQQLLAKTQEQQLKLAAQEKALKDQELKSQRQFRNMIIGGAALLGLLSLILFNRYQLKRKLNEQKALQVIRNNIASDLHDEVGSTLTSIHILSGVSQKNIEKDKVKVAHMLQKITEQSQSMQQAMSDIVWAIRPDNDKLQNMLVRMREYVSHTLEPKQVNVLFDAEPDVLQQTLNMQQRKDFFLIFKEAINNTAKYAGANNVSIHLGRNNGYIQMTITDDGEGFDINKITSSSGIRNMKERAGQLGGQIIVQSTRGKGTIIDLKVPAT
jgi:two-component system, NarL family, sensor histidine kinase UhpB